MGREVIQIGILGKDVEESESKLERLIGIGPFEILKPEYRDLTFRRKPGRFRIRVGLARQTTGAKDQHRQHGA